MVEPLGTMEWKGKSGTEYKYYIYNLDATHDAVPANYIFAKETSPDTFVAIYIGETGDISERFDYHHKMDCIKRNGATHIHTHKNSSDEKIRQAEEADLLAMRKTPCND